jgi:hypothetical protein
MHEDPILAFARDFSANSDAIVDDVRGYLADPPTDPETIGFYGSGSYAPRTRAFLATVSLLTDHGLLDAAEDKYTRELLVQWDARGLIAGTALPPAAKTVFGPLISGRRVWLRCAYRRRCWTLYAQATVELEQQVAARGRALLSIDATGGDTLFFAAVDPAVAARWRGKAFSEEDGYYAGVRPPMWDRFWDHLSCSTYLLDRDDRPGYPPGTPARTPTLPFAE